MPGISPAGRARRRTKSFQTKLAQASTPTERIQVGYDHLRAAMAVSSDEAIATEAEVIVTQLAATAGRLLAWRLERTP